MPTLQLLASFEDINTKGNTMKADFKTGAVWFLAGVLVMWLAQPDGFVRPVSAQGGAQAAINAEYEYNSQSVEAASIQTKLTELGSAGWEVFSVTSTDGVVDNAGDGKPHVVTQRFEVSAKRARKK